MHVFFANKYLYFFYQPWWYVEKDNAETMKVSGVSQILKEVEKVGENNKYDRYNSVDFFTLNWIITAEVDSSSETT